MPARRRRFVAPLMLGLCLAACHAPPRPLAPHRAVKASYDMAMLAACGPAAALQPALTTALMHGDAPEASPTGQCVALAAQNGSVPATLLLADVYGQAMSAGASSPSLRLDVFGRSISWLHMAAERGDATAQYMLAQATDGAATRPMPDTTLAWYQIAAQNGSAPALAAIGAAFDKGRIRDERLYALKRWLSEQANPAPAGRALLRRLEGMDKRRSL